MRLALGRQIGAFGLITTSNVHLGQARQVRKQGSNPWSKIDNQKNYLACTENVLADTYRAESTTHRSIFCWKSSFLNFELEMIKSISVVFQSKCFYYSNLLQGKGPAYKRWTVVNTDVLSHAGVLVGASASISRQQ